MAERTDTMDEAYESSKDKSEAYQRRIFNHILQNGDATCDEVEVDLGFIHQTASPSITKLTKKGFLRDSGQRRPTRTGCKAIVWTARSDNEEENGDDRHRPMG